MTAKMSDRGDNLTEANLQAEGLREEPAQKGSRQAGNGRRGQFPP